MPAKEHQTTWKKVLGHVENSGACCWYRPRWMRIMERERKLCRQISADIKVPLSSFALEPSSFVVFPCPHPICHTSLLVLSLYVPVSLLFPFDHLHLLGSDPLTWTMKTQTPHHSSPSGNHTSHISHFTCLGLFSVSVQRIDPYHFLHGPFPLTFISRHSWAQMSWEKYLAWFFSSHSTSLSFHSWHFMGRIFWFACLPHLWKVTQQPLIPSTLTNIPPSPLVL